MVNNSAHIKNSNALEGSSVGLIIQQEYCIGLPKRNHIKLQLLKAKHPVRNDFNEDRHVVVRRGLEHISAVKIMTEGDHGCMSFVFRDEMKL